MAFDGIVISNLVYELNQTILGQKISKIVQPEADELLITCKGNKEQYRVLLSANASLPFVYLTDENKMAPLTAPTFCMVLRKHIAGGKIIAIEQPNNERIIRFTIEHLNEMGDLCRKYLVVELMGKHSNIIFCSEDLVIIDSIKHVSPAMSSVRTVLPGHPYFIPNVQGDKCNPLTETREHFADTLSQHATTICKGIYTCYSGISPLLANEIAYRAGLDADTPIAALTEEQRLHLSNHFIWFMEDIKEHKFSPNIIQDGRKPVEFSCVTLKQFADYEAIPYDSISQVLRIFYAQKNSYSRIRQKSVDLRKVVSTVLERNVKKYDLQCKQLQDAQKREKYRIYGELLQTYGYGVAEGSKFLEAQNYYDENKLIKIPLDPQLTPLENATKYFDKYGKLKRTAEALEEQTTETKAQIDHLESIQNALDIAVSAEDLVQIKQELMDYGFIRKSKSSPKKERLKSKPFHYRSSAGYDIYVGKNNFQNDELTFKMATGNDWWFHAKGIPGSHVIVKSNNEELPDVVFEEAGKLAGYYSKGRESDKIEIDYLQKKNVKKPSGAVPGFVVYYTNYSLTIHPDISGIELLDE